MRWAHLRVAPPIGVWLARRIGGTPDVLLGRPGLGLSGGAVERGDCSAMFGLGVVGESFGEAVGHGEQVSEHREFGDRRVRRSLASQSRPLLLCP